MRTVVVSRGSIDGARMQCWARRRQTSKQWTTGIKTEGSVVQVDNK